MKQEDYEKAKEIDNRIVELTLQAERCIKLAKRLESKKGFAHINFGVGIGPEIIDIDEEAMKGIAEYYYKRHNNIQEQIGELKKEFYEI